jgi:hypothetical protein
MGVSVRYFVVEEGTERLVRLPIARWRRWLHGEELAPQYASRAVRVLFAYCGTENGRVVTVGDVVPLKVRFLADGRLDRERHRRTQVAKLNLSPFFNGKPERELDLMPRIERRRFEERTAFKVTSAHVRAFREALAGHA